MKTTGKILLVAGGIGAVIAAVFLIKRVKASTIVTKSGDGTVTIKDPVSGNTVVTKPTPTGTTTTTVSSTGQPVSTVVSTVNGNGTVTSVITTPTGTQTVTNPGNSTPVTGVGYLFSVPGVTLGIPTDLYNDYLLHATAYAAGGYPAPIQFDHSVAGQVAVQSYNNPANVTAYADPNGTDTFTNVNGVAVPNGTYAQVYPLPNSTPPILNLPPVVPPVVPPVNAPQATINITSDATGFVDVVDQNTGLDVPLNSGGVGQAIIGHSLQITAYPNNNTLYQFAGWSDGNQQPAIIINVTASGFTTKASFAAITTAPPVAPPYVPPYVPPPVTPPAGFNYTNPDGSVVYVGPGVPYYIDAWGYLEYI